MYLRPALCSEKRLQYRNNFRQILIDFIIIERDFVGNLITRMVILYNTRDAAVTEALGGLFQL